MKSEGSKLDPEHHRLLSNEKTTDPTNLTGRGQKEEFFKSESIQDDSDKNSYTETIKEESVIEESTTQVAQLALKNINQEETARIVSMSHSYKLQSEGDGQNMFTVE